REFGILLRGGGVEVVDSKRFATLGGRALCGLAGEGCTVALYPFGERLGGLAAHPKRPRVAAAHGVNRGERQLDAHGATGIGSAITVPYCRTIIPRRRRRAGRPQRARGR